jgi:hypothetical protein
MTPELPEFPYHYPVFPESDSERPDDDRPRNPYAPV